MDGTTPDKPCSDLKTFLNAHRCDAGNKPTHTRIGDKGAIRGGKYSIDSDKQLEFTQHYHKAVIMEGSSEYLTEKQLGEGGAIAIDIDLRYNPDIRNRQHNEFDILDMISIYLDVLKTIFVFVAKAVDFTIYVFEKPCVNLTNGEVTKDGIHIIICLQASNQVQLLIRDRVLEILKLNPNEIDFVDSLPLKDDCTWDKVLDEGISKGCVNWQMYGSKKPANDAYKLTGLYQITMDDTDDEFRTEQLDHATYEVSLDNFRKMSIRYSNHPEVHLQPSVRGILDQMQKKKTRSAAAPKGDRVLNRVPSGNLKVISRPSTSASAVLVAVDKIHTREEFETYLHHVEGLLQESAKDYKLNEVHEYAKILPERFYGAGSYSEWIRLGFALKNTDEALFVTWIYVSAKQSGFNYDDIPDLYDQWSAFDKKTDGGRLTGRSVVYWAKEYNYEEYRNVKTTTQSHFLDMSIENPNDREIAQVLHNLGSERFVCSSLTSAAQTWYEFEEHRWILDKGLRIRKTGISEDLYEVYYLEHVKVMSVIQPQAHNDEYVDDPEYKAMIRRNKSLTDIMVRCHNTVQKTHIAKEAAELFWDKDFSEKLDQDKYTMGFTNGIIDLQTGEFRQGRPLDYISMSTEIPYLTDTAMDSVTNKKYIAEVTEFMSQLFPDQSLREYMWEHLGSTLIGANLSQTFNIYKGSGSNGKSLMTELMSICLGDYCNPTAPISIITSRRQALGGTSSEVFALKSIRYAVFQEPTKGMVLNEGAMKEMTGDAKIQARELYQTSTSFNQMFSLGVCTNSLFEIKSQDDGTWRRLRIVDFKSCFKNPDVFDKMTPEQQNDKYTFKKDASLRDKLDLWAPVFMRLLVDRCVKNQGLVVDCDMVLAETDKYRLKQDLIAQFVQECIVAREGDNIAKQQLSQEWKSWCETNHASKSSTVPTVTELVEYMNNIYEKHPVTNGWKNATFLHYDIICND
jgi:P4 family phage/plasmid primase-like protien